MPIREKAGMRMLLRAAWYCSLFHVVLRSMLPCQDVALPAESQYCCDLENVDETDHNKAYPHTLESLLVLSLAPCSYWRCSRQGLCRACMLCMTATP